MYSVGLSSLDAAMRCRSHCGVGGFGGVDYAVHSEEERFRVGDEGVEAPRDGPASEEGFDVGDGVEDQENHRVRELIEAVHFS